VRRRHGASATPSELQAPELLPEPDEPGPPIQALLFPAQGQPPPPERKPPKLQLAASMPSFSWSAEVLAAQGTASIRVST